jgi:ABC-type multidrug transport system ATPase subunit
MQLLNRDLSKTYPKGVKALDSVSLAIPLGMYGLFGPHGASKTTLMRTVATLQELDSGSVRLGDIDGLSQKEGIRRRLGYLPQEFGVYPRISAQDMLSLQNALRQIQRLEQFLYVGFVHRQIQALFAQVLELIEGAEEPHLGKSVLLAGIEFPAVGSAPGSDRSL